MSEWVVMQLFRDICVVPTQSFRAHIATGGPIWPDFECQTAVRHCRNGRPVDQSPALNGADLEPLDAPCVWGGFIDRHFGHFVAEHLPRLLFSLRERPADIFLFTAEPGLSAVDLPTCVWDLLEWYGLARAQIRIVTSAIRVRELRAGPQAEMLPQVEPSRDYLALVQARAAANRLVPELADRLYVGRGGVVAAGGGGHAGEGYLVAVLSALGMQVLDPGAVPLRKQLALYAGAKSIVFAEGSAMHGRQLLGFIDQDIHVLRRRKGRSVARAMLRPRCRALVYRRTVDGGLMAYFRNGNRRPGAALAFYDKAALFKAFSALGIDLAAQWNDDAYRACVVADIDGWITSRSPRPAELAQYRDILQQVDLLPASLASDPLAKGVPASGHAPLFEGKTHGPVHAS